MNLFEKLRQQKLGSTAGVTLTLVLGILIGTVINTHWGPVAAQSGVTDATPLVVPAVSSIGNEFSQLAKKLDASVVNITVEVKTPTAAIAQDSESPRLRIQPVPPQGQGRPRQKGKQVQPQAPDDQTPDEGDIQDYLRRLIPDGADGQPEEQKHEASGTGFIVDKNGYIITNYHVVENAVKISVKLHGESTEYRARVIGTDFESDLAVIKIDAHRPMQPVSIANSDSVQVGDWAVAIGSPFGLEATVTAGIVSATGRGQDQLLSSARAFQSFIQTDAAINPGNSGGPLLNIKGEVIGVNTMIATSSGSSAGVGFALPVNMAVRVYNDIIKYGRVARGSLGVNLANANHPEALLKALGIEHGAVVETVRAEGPASLGGLKPNDIVTGINGKPIKDNQNLIATVADLPIGKPATLNVDRDGKKLDLTVTIQDRIELYKDDPRIVGTGRPAQDLVTASVAAPQTVQFGITIRSSVTDFESKLVPSGRGVVIKTVETGSFAEQVGLADNDIIDSINRKPVSSIEDIRKVQSQLKPGDAVAFHVVRPAPANARRRQADPEQLYLTDYLPSN
ncbi:MAG: trypsin-like peptidase domain-containing protein [Acidobacteriota bacterium]